MLAGEFHVDLGVGLVVKASAVHQFVVDDQARLLVHISVGAPVFVVLHVVILFALPSEILEVRTDGVARHPSAEQGVEDVESH